MSKFVWMNRLFFIGCFLILISCNRSYYPDEAGIASTLLGGNLQLLEVKTSHIASTEGLMYLYERKTMADKFVFVDSFAVRIGKNGFAWDDKSPFKFGSQKVKHEGDGCSPAGIFSLGPIFSYHQLDNLQMPFEAVDEKDICVDDIHSVHYNRLSDIDTITINDYASFELMKRTDLMYEYGIWVNYNTMPVIPGNGSCIFLHVWQDKHTPTSGCTAMSREDMIQLINWLDETKNPVLVQYAGR
jgi:D-alanyl-D-alanine dipeptidase